MRALFVLAFCGAAFGQGDARDLLRQISESARAMSSFRVEGQMSIDVHEPGTERSFPATFSTALRKPNAYRNEQNTPGATVLTVCEGEKYWVYFGNVNTYSRNTPNGKNACAPVVLTWEQLLDGVTSAVFAGRDQVSFEGRMQGCELVRAEYAAFPPVVGIASTRPGGTRTLCIDRSRNLILRDRIEAFGTTKTVSLTSAQVNADLPASLFAFVPPDGSKASGNPASAPPLADGVYRVGGDVSPPSITHKVDPEYSEEARQAKYSGSVVLSLIVQADGTPGNVRVVRPVGMGLDEKAIEAVKKWRFAPGMRQGVPVAVQSTIEMNFRLLEKPSQDGLFRVGGGVTAPQVLYRIEPRYSDEASRARLEGAVLINLVVQADGTPKDLKIVKSLEASLDRNALAAVAQWRFKPGEKSGAPVDVQATVEVHFKLLHKP